MKYKLIRISNREPTECRYIVGVYKNMEFAKKKKEYFESKYRSFNFANNIRYVIEITK